MKASGPKEVVAGGRKIVAVQGASVVFEAPLPEGDVLLRSGDQSVRANAVSWNRASG